MLGSAVLEKLLGSDYQVLHPRRSELDLRDYDSVGKYMEKYRPDAIVHSAALVGGIQMNIDSKSILLTENVQIDYNLISFAAKFRTSKFIYIASSCMYPANLGRPLLEDDLLGGSIEPTNYYYGLSKIIGTELIASFREQLGLNWTSIIASNLYGPNDDFSPIRAHLVAAIIQKIINAKASGQEEIDVWGDGTARREFTFSTDLADWIVKIVLNDIYLPARVNAGYGKDFSVREWYEIVCHLLEYDGQLKFDLSKPNGNQNKLLDSSLARSFGWNPQTSPEVGLQKTIDWYSNRKNNA